MSVGISPQNACSVVQPRRQPRRQWSFVATDSLMWRQAQFLTFHVLGDFEQCIITSFW